MRSDQRPGASALPIFTFEICPIDPSKVWKPSEELG
jgi:hypothetical protein